MDLADQIFGVIALRGRLGRRERRRRGRPVAGRDRGEDRLEGGPLRAAEIILALRHSRLRRGGRGRRRLNLGLDRALIGPLGQRGPCCAKHQRDCEGGLGGGHRIDLLSRENEIG